MAAGLASVVLGLVSLQYNLSSSWSRAVVSIVHRYAESVHLFVLTPDQGIGDFLIPSLDIPVVLNASSTDHQNQAGLYLVVCSNVSPVIALLHDDRISLARPVPWVVAFTDPTRKTLHQMFEVFFDRGTLDVVAVDPSLNIYSYFPFASRRCYNFQPVFMVNHSSRNFSLLNLFPKTKTKILYNCSVQVVLFPFAPDISLPTENSPALSSRLEEVIKIIAKKVMKFHPVFWYPLNKPKGIVTVLTNPRSLSLGLPYVNNEVQHASPLIYRCVTWCIPSNFIFSPEMDPLTNSFGWDMWAACAITVCGLIIVSRFLSGRYETFRSSWIFVVSVVVQIPTPLHYVENKARVLVISLYMAFLVIDTIFKARLHLLMAYSSPPSRLTEATQVYKSNLNLFRMLTNDTFLEDSMGNMTVSADRLIRFEHTDPYSVSTLYSAVKNGSAAVLADTDFCRSIIKKFGKSRAGYYKVYHLDSCVAVVPAPYFGFSENCPFAPRLGQVNTLLREYGLQQSLNTFLPKESPSLVPEPIDIEDLLIVIVIGVAGFILSLVVFVVELFAGLKKSPSKEIPEITFAL